ncbi:bifunctional adenosylcobinamide kinase/adenosylcobinamide-phosphate guanylyltransferase [Paenibacillus abyssi]|uniref:Adenosylcobinamide kinase n=1 Tax=Paenibacillus abyssi TaxID=1340531 RepID=A0A917D7I8_9BACL|nr:bifunctional adenosylcobinamide kinase/adenosylcobinamide-phosphate guanylyltransferase [Paenibacillus abyssi]GGG11630.1 adenosylcobinamide kinase/adenosylcobinamide phosphate guanyltransferase [Paenibacillus abyssi]
MAVLITGGARSGKSAFAEKYAMRCAGRGIYLATLQPYDEEMRQRIGKHRQEREMSGFAWETEETPFELVSKLKTIEQEAAEIQERPAVLVDCLTLWLTNWMLRIGSESTKWNEQHEAALEEQMTRLVNIAVEYPLPLLFVTNEVGSGIVPEYPLGRRFRDAAGRLNRRMAEISSSVFLVTAGIPVELKSISFRWDEDQ